MSKMWKIFRSKDSCLTESRDLIDEDNQRNFRELKTAIDDKLKQLTKQFEQSEIILNDHYFINSKEESLKETFEEMMATIEGLLSIVTELRAEYEDCKHQLSDYQQVKHMLSNHQYIISSIQESHSNQVAEVYEEKRKCEEELNREIASLRQAKEGLELELSTARDRIKESEQRSRSMEKQMKMLTEEDEKLKESLSLVDVKSRSMSEPVDKIDKKLVDVNNLKLEYMFYYGKIRERIVGYLGLKDLLHLQETSKFYHLILKKEQGKHIYRYCASSFAKKMTAEIRNSRQYDKIYDLFPQENIKTNAFKYLYFKIKPAAYMLPYLQEDQPEPFRGEPEMPKDHQPKFSWKSIFASEKVRGEKKEENKFSISSLRNQQEFRKIESRLQSTFKNIFQIKTPQDLQYFRDTMERQLEELKQSLNQQKIGKGSQLEWTAQLYCLSKYMYHEINELFNLLQVIFGQLVVKNKDLISIRQHYEYVRENEIVLRNLIENLSNDKANIEKRIFINQNQILKARLERQAIANKYERILGEHDQLKERLLKLEEQHLVCRKKIEKFQEDKQQIEDSFVMIRQEIDALQQLPSKSRRNSFASVSSEEHGGNSELIGY